jgi:antitoxin HigA-1
MRHNNGSDYSRRNSDGRLPDPSWILSERFRSGSGGFPRAINEIIHSKRKITAAVSIRLGTYFKQSPRFWLNIQTECDVRSALKDASALTSHIKPYEAVAESGGAYEA